MEKVKKRKEHYDGEDDLAPGISYRCDCADCLASQVMAQKDSLITNVWTAANWRMWKGQLVMVCPPGMAEGAMHFRNRGQQNLVEITCWPKPKTHLLTTGAANNELKNLRYRSEYLYIAHVVNMTLAETANWVEAWQKEAKYLASRRQKLLETKLTVKKKGKFWTLQTQTREGVSTSAQRKFRAWEEAVRAVRAIDEAKATYDRIQKEK